jgi:hypothetical protein
MHSPNPHRIPRGSTLVLVMVLLAVLSLVGVAAVTIASQERTNVSAKARRDLQIACARAAQLLIVAELARVGPDYVKSQTEDLPVLTLPDGTKLSHAHYDTPAGLKVVEITPDRVLPIDSNPSSIGSADLTNAFDTGGLHSGSVVSYPVVAKCEDAKGRQLEVEFVIAPAL